MAKTGDKFEKRPVVVGKDGLPVYVDKANLRVLTFCPICLSETMHVSTTKYNSYYGTCATCSTRLFLNTPSATAIFSAWQRIFRDELSRNLIMEMLAERCDLEEGLKK